MAFICKDDGVIDALTAARDECIEVSGYNGEPIDCSIVMCLACGRQDDHEQECPVWAIQRWLKNQGLARAYGATPHTAQGRSSDRAFYPR